MCSSSTALSVLKYCVATERICFFSCDERDSFNRSPLVSAREAFAISVAFMIGMVALNAIDPLDVTVSLLSVLFDPCKDKSIDGSNFPTGIVVSMI